MKLEQMTMQQAREQRNHFSGVVLARQCGDTGMGCAETWVGVQDNLDGTLTVQVQQVEWVNSGVAVPDNQRPVYIGTVWAEFEGNQGLAAVGGLLLESAGEVTWDIEAGAGSIYLETGERIG